MSEPISADLLMRRIDGTLSHVWMVRTFLKHSEEAEDDDELRDVHRTLYDFMLALGKPWEEGNAKLYIKQAKKKLSKLKRATELFVEIQPEISGHMNFRMAVSSLALSVSEIERILGEA